MFSFNPIVLKKAKIVYNFGLSDCNRVKELVFLEIREAQTMYMYTSAL